MVNPVCGQGMAEGIGDLRLADEFGKSLWTIPAIKSVNHTWSLPGSTDDGSGQCALHARIFSARSKTAVKGQSASSREHRAKSLRCFHQGIPKPSNNCRSFEERPVGGF